MKIENLKISDIPAVLYGESLEKLFLFIHGKCGFKEEGERFAKIACESRYSVLSIDLPEHGERKDETDTFFPWIAVPELNAVMEYVKPRFERISLRANSIGAWFSMLAFKNEPMDKALYVSPILDMEKLITDMMKRSSVSEEELFEKGEIKTAFGETFSYRYLEYARNNRITNLSFVPSVLYSENDNLTSRETVNDFAKLHECKLSITEKGEHWFHTEEQLCILENWEKEEILI